MMARLARSMACLVPTSPISRSMSRPDAGETLILQPVEFCISLIDSPPVLVSKSWDEMQSQTKHTLSYNHSHCFSWYHDAVVHFVLTACIWIISAEVASSIWSLATHVFGVTFNNFHDEVFGTLLGLNASNEVDWAESIDAL